MSASCTAWARRRTSRIGRWTGAAGRAALLHQRTLGDGAPTRWPPGDGIATVAEIRTPRDIDRWKREFRGRLRAAGTEFLVVALGWRRARLGRRTEAPFAIPVSLPSATAFAAYLRDLADEPAQSVTIGMSVKAPDRFYAEPTSTRTA